MKHLTFLTLFALHSSLFTLFAGVPLSWTVETTRVQPATFDVVRGETIALEASFNNAGKPFAMDGYDCSIFWQTNGMGSAWWTAPAAAASNRVSATFTPEMDPGASTVIGFLGSTGQIYRASFQLRFRHGPGATPNALPLPVPVIDFALVRVLNPPWGAGGVDTNAFRDIIHKTVDGAARPLPKYLWLYEAADSYPAEAQEYYRSRGDGKVDGGCSSVRDGGFLSRNFDFPFDNRSEFVVKMSAGPNRFASVGVSQVGTNLTEEIVTSGKPEFSARYKWLPGATVDGINERGVACNINVVDGDPQTSGWHTTGDLHPLAAIRWSLDNGTSAGMVASNLAANIRFPQDWSQNYHYMVADERETWIVENGGAHKVGEPAVMTNFSLYPDYDGMGWERFRLLALGANITNVWYTNAYRRETSPMWESDLREVLAYTNEIFDAWAAHDKEYFRNQLNDGKTWWQTVHTSVYDLTNRTLRVAVQENDDWYVFAIPGGTGVSPDQARAIAAEVVAPVVAEVRQKIGGDEVPDHETDPTVPDWAKAEAPPSETDPTVPEWAKEYDPPWEEYDQDLVFYGHVAGFAFDGIGTPEGYPRISLNMGAGRYEVYYDPDDHFFLEPPPDISGKADRAELTAATNEVIHVIKDAAKNLKYTITGDNGRFYMTPIGAINPED